MSGYYDDPDKLTYDEAAEYVDRWVDEHRGLRTTVRVLDIVNSFDVPDLHHNKHRIHAVLDRRFSVSEASGQNFTRFEIPDEDADEEPDGFSVAFGGGRGE